MKKSLSRDFPTALESLCACFDPLFLLCYPGREAINGALFSAGAGALSSGHARENLDDASRR